MQLDEIQALLSDDLDKVNKLIKSGLYSNVPLINDIAQYIVSNGGKRLRPLLVLLCANACGYQGRDHITYAAVIEFIHTATLLHDDVVDASNLRRGEQTANAIWGNEAAVLSGDFLYSQAFHLMVQLGNVAVMQNIATATKTMAEGEALQLLHQSNCEITIEDYQQIIANKTAELFKAAAAIGPLLLKEANSDIAACRDFGHHLGLAFQISDDLLDYIADDPRLGKQRGDDLAEGKPTLPLIYLLQNGSQRLQSLAKQALTNKSREYFNDVCEAIESCGGFTYTIECARQHAKLAKQSISGLPKSEYLEGCLALADFAVNRVY